MFGFFGRRRKPPRANYPVPPGTLYPPARLVGGGWSQQERNRIAGVPAPMNTLLGRQRPVPVKIMRPPIRWGVPNRPAPRPTGQPRPVISRQLPGGGTMQMQAFGRKRMLGPDFNGVSAQVSFPRPGVQPIVSDQDYQNQIRSRIAGIQNPFDVTMAQLPGMRRVQSERAKQESQRIGAQLQRQARTQLGTQLDYQRNLLEGSAGLQRANQFMDIAQRLFQSNTNLGRLRRQSSLAEIARRLWLMGVLG